MWRARDDFSHPPSQNVDTVIPPIEFHLLWDSIWLSALWLFIEISTSSNFWFLLTRTQFKMHVAFHYIKNVSKFVGIYRKEKPAPKFFYTNISVKFMHNLYGIKLCNLAAVTQPKVWTWKTSKWKFSSWFLKFPLKHNQRILPLKINNQEGKTENLWSITEVGSFWNVPSVIDRLTHTHTHQTDNKSYYIKDTANRETKHKCRHRTIH